MRTLYLNEGDLASALTKQLADNVRKRSKELGMTQSELSERSGVAASHLSHISHGKANPTLATLERVADVLGQSVIELLAPDSSASQAEAAAPAKKTNGER
jgi:transcriptional regulator with XRE-family HTH domain